LCNTHKNNKYIHKFNMKKQSNKKIRPLIPNPSGNYFEPTLQPPGQSSSLTGTGYDTLAWQKLATPMTEIKVTGGPDLSKITAGGVSKLNAAGAVKAPVPGIGAYLGTAQGAVQLGSQVIDNLDTSGIGKEVAGTGQMTRGDILNTNVNVDSGKTNVGGQALSGAMTGASAGLALGPLGALVGGGIGALAGGISSLIGNEKKQKAADAAEQQ
jgi:hypothetical protein